MSCNQCGPAGYLTLVPQQSSTGTTGNTGCNPTLINNLVSIDASCISLLNQIYQAIIAKMLINVTDKLNRIYRNSLVIGCSDCNKRVKACDLTICELIEIINNPNILNVGGSSGIQSTFFGFNVTYTIRPFALGLTDNDQFVPIADGYFGGLYANPIKYNVPEIEIIYQQAILNPLGEFVNFRQRAEGFDNCPLPARAYVRILPICFKGYKAIIIGVSYLIFAGGGV